MGKKTGFMEYERVGHKERPISERVHDFNEFNLQLSWKERSRQGARCMDCGVPFCQAGIVFDGKRVGCPLHNLIPEWNDMIYLDNPEHALSRPHSRSSPDGSVRRCVKQAATASMSAVPSPFGTTSCISLSMRSRTDSWSPTPRSIAQTNRSLWSVPARQVCRLPTGSISGGIQ